MPRLAFAGFVASLALGFAVDTPVRASAESDTRPEVIVGAVNDQYVDDDGNRVREPVPGVELIISTDTGDEIVRVVTDEAGAFRVEVPDPGTYQVAINEESLPEGVLIVDATKTPRPVTVNPESQATAVFFLGVSTTTVVSRWDLLPQNLFNGFKLAAIIAICSIGLALVYATTGLSNFAHGEIVTFGAFAAWVFNSRLGMHLIPSAIIAIALTAAVSVGMEKGVWKPMRRRRSSLTSMMIVSIGLALGVRYIYQFIFGARYKNYSNFSKQAALNLGPFTVTPRALWVIGICIVLSVATSAWLLYTRQGRAIRAVSDNPSLASSTGINSDNVIAYVWMVGGALAATGGVLYGLEIGVQWDMGFRLLLLMFAAVTLGGLGNPFGAILGSVVIGIFVELWAWVFPNAVELKTIGAMLILIVVLLVRPQGLLGTSERAG
jgi:branched-subunit amino acid ABC-type transport system permease component